MQMDQIVTSPTRRILPSQRHLFDIPTDVAYFNTAYNSPQLNSARESLHLGVARKSHPWERTADDFFEDADTIRVLAAALFGGDDNGWAVVPSASYAASSAARILERELAAGMQILVIQDEFPSNYLPWHRAAEESQASLSIVTTPDDGDWTTAILNRIDRSTRIVAVSSCHWTSGARIDLQRIAAACRAVNASLAVDATQTLGAVPLSINDVQPDFLFAAGYKWLLAPYGFGLFYVSERWRDSRPLEEVWLAREGARDFAGLTTYSQTYRPGARRFDVGETCTDTILPGAIAALQQLQTWGVHSVAETLNEINSRLAIDLERLGFVLPPAEHRCPHMFGATLPESYRGDLVTDLRKRHVYVSRRGNAIRFAPHLHVEREDERRLLDALLALA
jgi:selenocysteine lyase/cysteine desulfurase